MLRNRAGSNSEAATVMQERGNAATLVAANRLAGGADPPGH